MGILSIFIQTQPMKKIFLLLTVLSLASCKTANKPITSPADRFLIEDLVELTSAEIKNRYPEANIKEDVGMFDEGTDERPYTILFPDTPDELHITWDNPEKTRTHDIRFSEGKKWKSNTGIKVGTTYKELNQLNGNDISFYGFGWDYSGAVVWNDGKFENSGLFVFLEAKGIPGKFYADHIIKATPEEIALMDMKVKTIMYKR